MRIRSKNKDGTTNIAIYPLCVLFSLCTLFCAIDTAQTLFILRFESSQVAQVGLTSYNMNIANTAFYCVITFLAQGVLIYRCWVIWGKNLLVLSVPSILAWLSLGASLAMLGGLIEPPASRVPDAKPKSWYYSLSSAAFSASLGVNAILAILLAVKTFTLIREAQKEFTAQKRRVHPIRQFVAILNESGMLMLACQIIWLVLFRRNNPAFYLVRGSIVMIYGLTPTLILQRILQPLGKTTLSVKEKPRRRTAVRFTI
jgi:hypothetical protein